MGFQLWLRVSCKSLLCFVFFFFCGTSALLQAEKHSLYYIYTALSKPVDLPGIYEFTAMGLLDDTQIDYYNSKDKRMIPTQSWMIEKLQEDYWEKGTQSRKSKEQWFHQSLKNLMDRMRHDDSAPCVLQWKVGCEVEQQGSEVKFLKGVSEFGYNGENLLFFDIKKAQWVALVDAAQETKKIWDNTIYLKQYTKGYLEKECVDWLNKFREYGDEKLRNGSPPDVHVFAKRYKSKLKLTCMATGFYPKDLMMNIRKYRTSLPEDKMKSTAIRPNHDGSFQIKKSVDIKEEEKDEYDCVVSHKGSIIIKWDRIYSDCSQKTATLMIGFVIGVVFMLIADLVVYILVQKMMNAGQAKKKSDSSATDSEEQKNEDDVMIEMEIPSDSSRTAPKTIKI